MNNPAPISSTARDEGISLEDTLQTLRQHRLLLSIAPVLAGIVAYGVALLIAPTFTATTTFIPPQQVQNQALSAVASLGALASLATGGGGVRTSADQYVALMQSVTVSDRIIDHFKLMEAYEARLRVDARKALTNSVQMSVGKKDGWITVAVEDESPQRAANMANRYVDELRRISSSLAVTEAQQRRIFFEAQLGQVRERLVKTQQALQASGFNAGALQAEPRAAAEAFARLKAEATAAEVRLHTLRGSLADGTPEVRQQLATLTALRDQLARAEQSGNKGSGPDYLGKYRDFKYQETLFELYVRQFELARVDESREGALIQVVDAATPPERRTKPKRMSIAFATLVLTTLLLASVVLVRQAFRPRGAEPVDHGGSA